MIKVSKFGGSSVANSEQFKKVKKIVESDNDRKFIVTSACGKIDKNDYKITDLLYLTYAHIKFGVSYDDIFSKIEKKYQTIKDDLKLQTDIDKEFIIIKNNIKEGISEDYLVSRGEYLTAKLLADYLGFIFLDAKDFICFDYDGNIDLTTSKNKFFKIFNKNSKYVVPGFYGSFPNNDIKVMSRGGSDITGSILANIIDANLYENWTDVSGILMCDPRIVDNPQKISYISYDELREVSYMGANVLHDEAIFPVKEKNIPINIKNTNNPEDIGTMIVSDCKNYDAINTAPIITGITGKKDFYIVNVKKNHISSETGILRKALKIFEELNISVESVPASVDAFCIVVEKKYIEKYQYEIVATLKHELDTKDVSITKDIALIAMVGRSFYSHIGLAGKIFKALGDNNINIRIINQGSDEINITVGVANEDFEKAINCIYNHFVLNEK